MGLSVALFIVAGGIAAVFQHPVGIAPILGAIVCAACFFKRWELLAVAVGAMLFRDAIVGFSLFTLVRLVGILAVVGIIWAVRVRPSLGSLLLGVALTSPVYHLALAVGDWALQFCVKSPRTPEGLASSIASSLPYFQRVFVGEVLFASVFLALFTLSGSLVASRWPSLVPQRIGRSAR